MDKATNELAGVLSGLLLARSAREKKTVVQKVIEKEVVKYEVKYISASSLLDIDFRAPKSAMDVSMHMGVFLAMLNLPSTNVPKQVFFKQLNNCWGWLRKFQFGYAPVNKSDKIRKEFLIRKIVYKQRLYVASLSNLNDLLQQSEKRKGLSNVKFSRYVRDSLAIDYILPGFIKKYARHEPKGTDYLDILNLLEGEAKNFFEKYCNIDFTAWVNEESGFYSCERLINWKEFCLDVLKLLGLPEVYLITRKEKFNRMEIKFDRSKNFREKTPAESARRNKSKRESRHYKPNADGHDKKIYYNPIIKTTYENKK